MLTKKELQFYASLNKKKVRKSESLFVVEGKRIVEEGCNSNSKPEIIFFTEEFYAVNFNFIEKLKTFQVKMEMVNKQSFNKIADTKNPQGIAAVFHKNVFDIDAFNNTNIIIALENISDPGNLGTILRTCAWFGFEKLIISSDSVDLYNPKVLRSSMGAIFHLQIFQTLKFHEFIKAFKHSGYEILVADIKGEDVFGYKPGNKCVLTFCNEANGASSELIEISTRCLSIPQNGTGESLNVAAAAAIIIAQISKRITDSGNK